MQFFCLQCQMKTVKTLLSYFSASSYSSSRCVLNRFFSFVILVLCASFYTSSPDFADFTDFTHVFVCASLTVVCACLCMRVKVSVLIGVWIAPLCSAINRRRRHRQTQTFFLMEIDWNYYLELSLRPNSFESNTCTHFIWAKHSRKHRQMLPLLLLFLLILRHHMRWFL